MIHAYLISGSTSTARLAEAEKVISQTLKRKINHPWGKSDLIFIEEEGSIKIDQVRQLKRNLQLKPQEWPVKIVLINQAEKMTLPAQHALLKTLEEPPGETIIILTTGQIDLLLPTIVSRCQTIRLTEPNQSLNLTQAELKKAFSQAEFILKKKVGERLKAAESVSQSRELAQAFLNQQVYLWRRLLKRKASQQKLPSSFKNISLGQILRLIKNLQKTANLIHQQANLRLVMDNLFICYPKFGG